MCSKQALAQGPPVLRGAGRQVDFDVYMIIISIVIIIIVVIIVILYVV